MEKLERNRIVYAITLVIVWLLIISSVNIVATEEEIKNEKSYTDPIRTVIHHSVASTNIEIREKRELTKYSASKLNTLGTDFAIFENGEMHVQNPSIVSDGSGNLLVLGEFNPSIFSRSLFGRWSTNNGESWISEDEIYGWEFEDAYTKPKIDYYGSGKTAWGTLVPEGALTNDVHYIEFPDITDPEAPSENADGWTAWHVEWGNQENIDSTDVACYSDESNIPSPEYFGAVGMTGDNNYGGYEEDKTMMFSHFTEGGSVQLIFFYDMFADCSNMAVEIDQSNGQYYMVSNYENETDSSDTGAWLLTAQIYNDPDWWSTSWPGVLFNGLNNPQIAASNGRVYVVGELLDESTDNSDIQCWTTTDPEDGQSWESFMVTDTTDVNEKYPSVSTVGGLVICSYISDGDIYTSISEDNGQTWVQNPGQVNDESGTAYEQYSSMNLGDEFIVWTDERSFFKSVYFDKALDVSIPKLEITSISGGIGVKATITNTGSAPAENVDWSIVTEGTVFLGGEKSGQITLQPDETKTIKTGLMLGFGNIDVTVTLDTMTKTASGKLLLFFITGLA